MNWYEEREAFYYRRYKNNPALIDQEPTILAMARAHCIYGTNVIQTNQWDESFWGEFSRTDVPTYGEIRYRGGMKAVQDRIRRGSLGIEKRLEPWTGSFWRGLQLSGALRTQSLASWGRYQIWEASHSALVSDIEQASVGKHFEMATGKSGCRRLSRTPSMLLPAKDDADILAGLFAGALLEVDPEKDTWLVLPGSGEVKALLQQMTILFHPRRPFRGQARIAVSPFYAPLFASRMPPESAKRILAIRRPSLGELLSLMYWTAYFGGEGKRIPPFANALPYSIAPRTYRRRRYNRYDLHKTAVLEYKILSLAKPLRTAMEAWFREASCSALVKTG